MSEDDVAAELETLLRQTVESLIRTEGELEAERSARREPIAIVSMACRLPAGATTPEAYWELLASGADMVSRLPARFHPEDIYDADPEMAGKTYVRDGGCVEDAELFDAGFFEISPREALSMDPQQRLVLETCWEALERAGIRKQTLNQSATGVYLGSMGSDYGMRDGLTACDGFMATGTAGSVLSGRVAYVLGLQGPTMTIDTACSSSLVSLHLACAALRNNECELALAGGVTVMSTPASFVEFSRSRVLSMDARCKSFSSTADGIIWGEGCGILVLKRLSDAQRDGDKVLAVVRGSAVNQDGKSQGLTAPNGPSQQRVIMEALASARLSPADIDAIEAHGTGTMLGDPIEAGALGAVFGPDREPSRPVYLGSSKSNLGHSQAAAGVAGVMKMVMALQHELLPKTLHVAQPSPHIQWQGSGLSLLREARAWPRSERVRRAGISSFGIGGTNAHVVIEEAPLPEPDAQVEAASASHDAPVLPVQPLFVSGQSSDALRDQAGRWASWLSERPELSLPDLLSTAAYQRTQFEVRAALQVSTRDEALRLLRSLADGESHAEIVTGRAQPRGKLVFVFPGQGGQWREMGRSLLTQSAAFRAAIDDCDRALRPITGWSVRALLSGQDRTLPFDRTDVVQPALFAMYVALAAVWRSLGIEPQAVVGHSQGEVAAAVVAGALSLEDGARVIALRSKASNELGRAGAMLIIERPLAEVESLIAPFGEALSVAAVNTASSTIVSGDVEAAATLHAQLESSGVFSRTINVDRASHSAHVDAALPRVKAALASLRPRSPRVPMYSTVTGALLSAEDRLDADYWCRNLRDCVRFDRALDKLLMDGFGTFIEVSAHPVLAIPMTNACARSNGVVVGTLQRERGELKQVLLNLSELHVRGVDVPFEPLFGPDRRSFLTLPTYAFQRTRFWLDTFARPARNAEALGLSQLDHPLLGATATLAETEGHVFSGRLSPKEQPFLAEHAAFGSLLLPGAGTLELSLMAARTLGASRVSELTLWQPMLLDAGPLQVQLAVSPADEHGVRSLRVYSRPEDGNATWTQNAAGVLSDLPRQEVEDDAPLELLRAWPVDSFTPVAIDGFYDKLAQAGLHFGPSFRGLQTLWRNHELFLGTVALPDSVKDADSYGIHPALLDAAMHVLIGALSAGRTDGQLMLLFAWHEVELLAAGPRALRVAVRAELAEDAEQARADVWLTDLQGQPVLRGSVELRRARPELLRNSGASVTQHLYRTEFLPVALDAQSADGQTRVVLGNSLLLRALTNAPSFGTYEALAEALDRGTEPPARIIVDASTTEDSALSTLLTETSHATALLHQLRSDPRLQASELVWVTRGAVAHTADSDVSDLAHASLWGLLRAQRSELGQRAVRLIDVDPAGAGLDAPLFERALALHTEPALCLRAGSGYGARLVRAAGGTRDGLSLRPEGTVLITGASGELGRALAEHLVREHAARHLVLVVQEEPESVASNQLVALLQTAGADSVELVQSDLRARQQVVDLLALANARHPLRVILHVPLNANEEGGGATDQQAHVLQTMVAPAHHLVELSAALPLDLFVLGSGVHNAVALSQPAHAATSALFDAFAARRRSAGLPATSLAFGPIAHAAGVAAHSRSTLGASLTAHPLAELGKIFDAAMARPEPSLSALRIDLPKLQKQLKGDTPALLRTLIRPVLRRAGTAQEASALHARLAALPERERLETMLQVVQAEIAAVLGIASGSAVDPERELQKQGLDSVMAVQLSKRLSEIVGEALPSTLMFDYRTPAAIAGFLVKQEPGVAKLSSVGKPKASELRHKVRINGIDMVYTERGQGEEVLLFAHGWMGTGIDFLALGQDFGAGYRCIIPDMRGHGETGHTHETFTMKQCALDLLALMDHLGVQRFHAVGMSMGTLVLQHVATMAPERVDGLLLISPQMHYRNAAHLFKKFADNKWGEADWANMRKRHVLGDEQIQLLWDQAHSFVDNPEDTTFSAELFSTITARTLIVGGDRDMMAPIEMSFEIYRAIPNAQLWIVPDGQHVPLWGGWERQFTEVAMRFLKTKGPTEQVMYMAGVRYDARGA